MSGQFPPKRLSVAILSRLCYLQRRLTGLDDSHLVSRRALFLMVL